MYELTRTGPDDAIAGSARRWIRFVCSPGFRDSFVGNITIIPELTQQKPFCSIHPWHEYGTYWGR